MTSEITLSKAEFKLDLEEAGLTVLDYIPERIVPPIVIINNRTPYLTPSRLGTEYLLNLELVLVASTATNKQASENLDQAIENALTLHAQATVDIVHLAIRALFVAHQEQPMS